MHSTRSGAFLRLASALAVGSLAIPLLLALLLREEQHAPPGGEITHDDFAFRVVAVERRVVGIDSASESRREFTIVQLAITNRAKRLPFDLGGWTPVLVDASGGVHTPHVEAQRALVRAEGELAELNGMLERGGTTTRLVAFDVLGDVHQLQLEIRWGTGLVNAFEDFVFGSRTLALGTARAH